MNIPLTPAEAVERLKDIRDVFVLEDEEALTWAISVLSQSMAGSVPPSPSPALEAQPVAGGVGPGRPRLVIAEWMTKNTMPEHVRNAIRQLLRATEQYGLGGLPASPIPDVGALVAAGHKFMQAVNFRETNPDELTVAEYEFQAALSAFRGKTT